MKLPSATPVNPRVKLAKPVAPPIGWPTLTMKTNPRLAARATALGFTLLLASCYEVPVTGRHALNTVSDSDMAKKSIAEFEHMKATHKLSTDRALNDRLQRVGERLRNAIPIWDMPDADWEFVLFDDKGVNAFAMAGGKVGVLTGLFKIVENDDQLASVLGHEIAHVTAKHTNSAESRAQAMEILGTAGMIAGMASPLGLYGASSAHGLYVLGATAVQFKFSREQEKEADYIGMIYMARAGYNPEECSKVLDKLDQLEAAEGNARAVTWTSSHPSNPERIGALQDAVPKALKAQKQAQAVNTPTVIK